ncbi:MAG: hypothetical protein ACT4PV_09735 [Planctomycetaceae bacterium]
MAGLETIRSRLAGLRRRILLALALEGSARVAGALFLAVVTSFVLDRFFKLETAARAALLVAALAWLAYVAWRYLAARLGRPLSEDALATAVEARFPELKDRLVTAIQLSRETDPERWGMSPHLVAEAIRAAEEPAGSVRFRDALALKQVFRAVALGIAALALLGAGAAADPESARTWFARNVLLRDLRWPQKTYLELDPTVFVDGAARIVRGGNIVVTAFSRGEVHPEKVLLHYRDSEGEEGQAMMKADPAALSYRHEFREVVFPITFRLEGGDEVTRDYRIELVLPPEAMEIEVEIGFPEYAGREGKLVDLAAGDPEVLAGGSLTLRGRSSKPLEEAALVLGEGEEEIVPAILGSGDRFEARFLPKKTVLVGLRLLDRDGLTNPAFAPRFLVRVVPDRAPKVRLRLQGIGSMVVPVAWIPYEVRIRDDVKATEGRLEATASADDRAAPDPHRIHFDPAGLGGETAELRGVLELEALGLSPGAFLTLIAYATDNASPEVQEGRSDPVSLRIVTLEDLLSDLVRRQQEQRQAFEELVTKETRLRDELQDRRDKPPAAPSDVREFGDAQAREQRQIARRVNTIEREMAQVLDEMQNNRISDASRIHELRRGVVDALGDLRKVLLEEQSLRLDEIARLAGEAPLGGRPGEDAAVGYEAILRAMQAVLAHMIRVESFTEIVESWRALMELQGSARAAAYRRWLEEMRTIFPDFTPPDGNDSGR